MTSHPETVIEIEKNIGGKVYPITIVAGRKKESDVSIKVVADGMTTFAEYFKQHKAVGWRCPQTINNQKIGGFRLSADDCARLESHINAAEASYTAEMDRRTEAVYDGREAVKVWRYGNATMMVTLHADHEGLDWVQIINGAAQQWISKHFPLVERYDYDQRDLHRGLMCANDAADIDGAVASSETYKTMGGDTHPEYVLVPLPALMQRTCSKKYASLQSEYIAAKRLKTSLIEEARRTGEKQLLDHYVSADCLENLPDCSFDAVYIWIDSEGEISKTWSHCH